MTINQEKSGGIYIADTTPKFQFSGDFAKAFIEELELLVESPLDSENKIVEIVILDSSEDPELSKGSTEISHEGPNG